MPKLHDLSLTYALLYVIIFVAWFNRFSLLAIGMDHECVGVIGPLISSDFAVIASLQRDYREALTRSDVKAIVLTGTCTKLLVKDAVLDCF